MYTQIARNTQFKSILLELEQQYAQREKHAHPNARRGEAHPHDAPLDAPAALRDRAQTLHRLRQRQHAGHPAHARPHALDRPNDAAQHDNGQKAAERQIRGRPFRIARGRHQKPVAHATETGQRDQQATPQNRTANCQLEDDEAEQQHGRHLHQHDDALRGHVREQDLQHRDAADETTLEHALVALDDHGAGCQGDGQKEDDGQNDAGRREIGKVGRTRAVDRRLEGDRNAAELDGQIAGGQQRFDEIEERVLEIAPQRQRNLLVCAKAEGRAKKYQRRSSNIMQHNEHILDWSNRMSTIEKSIAAASAERPSSERTITDSE